MSQLPQKNFAPQEKCIISEAKLAETAGIKSKLISQHVDVDCRIRTLDVGIGWSQAGANGQNKTGLALNLILNSKRQGHLKLDTFDRSGNSD